MIYLPCNFIIDFKISSNDESFYGWFIKLIFEFCVSE